MSCSKYLEEYSSINSNVYIKINSRLKKAILISSIFFFIYIYIYKHQSRDRTRYIPSLLFSVPDKHDPRSEERTKLIRIWTFLRKIDEIFRNTDQNLNVNKSSKWKSPSHPKKILVKSYSVTRYWKMVENFKANAENGWRRPFYESPLEWWKQGYRGTEWQPNPVFVERFHHGPHTYRSRTHETGIEARLIIKPCARNRATSASRTGLNLAFWFTSRNSVPAVELRISEITAVFKISIESFYQNFLFKRIHPPIRMPRKLRSSS